MAKPRSLLIALAVLLACFDRALADGPAEKPAAFAVDSDGVVHPGALVGLTAEQLVLEGTPRRGIPLRRVLRYEQTARAARPPMESGPAIVLANGDRLGARVARLDDDRLEARWGAFPAWGALDVPLESVRGIVLAPPPLLPQRHALVALLADRRDESDLLLLAGGDRLEGELIGLDDKGVAFRGAAGEVRIARAQAQAVGLNASLVSVRKIAGRRALLRLADGSLVTLLQPRLDGAVIAAEPAFGGRIEVPLSAVTAIRFLGDPAVALSDLAPAGYEFTPYVSGDWKLAVDQSATGTPLRLRGVEHPKGLGMHSRSAVHYDLDGKHDAFLATVGIDDAAQGRGNAVFAVEVDGERVFESPPLTGTDAPRQVGPIDVRGKKRLTLIVDFGQLADVQDYGNWCDAVLVKRTDDRGATAAP